MEHGGGGSQEEAGVMCDVMRDTIQSFAGLAQPTFLYPTTLMESLNLNTLASSLPTAHQNAEKDLLNNFKAAALSITTLYRSSRQNSKRAYNAGYAAACQDLLTMIQQGVSLNPSGSSHDAEGGGMTIGRVMDWTEARLEAIKSREEEEDEDEEREKEKDRGRPPATSADAKPDDKPQAPVRPSPSPPPSASVRPIQRATRARPPSKADSTAPATPGFEVIPDGLSAFPTPASFSDIPIPIAAGAKRRHAMMMMLDSASSPATSSSAPHSSSTMGNGASGTPGALSSRRRTRSSRNLALQQSHNQNLALIQSASEAMDVEDDGRERKRVARR